MAENYITKRTEKGTVNISQDVIAAMVSAVVAEIDGVTGFGNPTTPELIELFGKKSAIKGQKIRTQDDKIAVDVLLTVKLGGNITDIALHVQDAVSKELEAITGMGSLVNVHITGVSLDK